MRKMIVGLICGTISGGITALILAISDDFQGNLWSSYIAAFIIWLSIDFFVATSTLKIDEIKRGVIFSLMIILPYGLMIVLPTSEKYDKGNILAFLMIIAFMLIIGGFNGFLIGAFGTEKEKQNKKINKINNKENKYMI